MKKQDGWLVYHECGELQMQIAGKLLSMYKRAGDMNNEWRVDCLEKIHSSLDLCYKFWGN